MTNRKNILFIARWYPDRHDPMLGLFVQKHAQAVQAFHDITVLYVTSDTTLVPGKVLTDTTTFENIKEHRIYFGKHRNHFSNAIAYWKHYLNGIAAIKKQVGLPALVHVHILTRTALPAIWLKIFYGIPYIITEHWSRYLPANISQGAWPGWFRRLFARIAVRMSSGVTTVTENLGNAMRTAGLNNKYYVTPNVADIHEFKPLEKSIAKIKKLVHVSCFDEPAKNIKGIINAVQKIATERNDFILEIIGDGKDYNDVKQYASQTELTGSRMFFTGLLTGTDLTQKMREASALVMFSNYENLPCTIVESLCCGVPVISTDVGGISEHLLPEFGILIPPGDENALIIAINYMLNNYMEFDSVKMRNYSEQHFSMEKIGTIFNTIYADSGIN